MSSAASCLTQTGSRVKTLARGKGGWPPPQSGCTGDFRAYPPASARLLCHSVPNPFVFNLIYYDINYLAHTSIKEKIGCNVRIRLQTIPDINATEFSPNPALHWLL